MTPVDRAQSSEGVPGERYVPSLPLALTIARVVGSATEDLIKLALTRLGFAPKREMPDRNIVRTRHDDHENNELLELSVRR